MLEEDKTPGGDAKNAYQLGRDFKKTFKNSIFIKDLKRLKEDERKRRSKLIYGCEDMRVKIHEQKMKEQNKKNKNSMAEENDDAAKSDAPRVKKNCKDYFWLDTRGRFLSTFDTFMLLIVAYSCFSSAYFTAFDFPPREENELVF